MQRGQSCTQYHHGLSEQEAVSSALFSVPSCWMRSYAILLAVLVSLHLELMISEICQPHLQKPLCWIVTPSSEFGIIEVLFGLFSLSVLLSMEAMLKFTCRLSAHSLSLARPFWSSLPFDCPKDLIYWQTWRFLWLLPCVGRWLIKISPSTDT